MKLASLFEHRAQLLEFQQAVLDNKYGLDLETNMISSTGLHVELKPWVDEVITYNNGKFSSRSAYGPISTATATVTLGATAKDAAARLFPRCLLTRLGHELRQWYSPRHDVYGSISSQDAVHPATLTIEWDVAAGSYHTVFMYSPKGNDFIGVFSDGSGGSEERLSSVDECLEFAKKTYRKAAAGSL